MSGVDNLFALLDRFDEDAFVALANRGLLRRAQKDLERVTVETVERSADTLTVSVGEYQVRFDAGGPAKAVCSCPANGVCQHLLSAALSLKAQGSGQPTTPSASAPAEADPMQALRDALLAIPASALVRHAGKAGYRWAWQFLQDLGDGPAAPTISGEQHWVITFARPRVSWRYLGGDVDALIADTELPQINRHRVAAVLAFQRAHGQALVPPEPTGRSRDGSADGEGAPDTRGGDGPSTASARDHFRIRVRRLLVESIELGLAHLSRGIHERFATMAVAAQGVEYPRLALLLRRITDHVELLIERQGGADEHRLLDEITLAFAIVSALDEAARRGEAPAHLVGRSRTDYAGAGTIELLGLGARAWRSASGYVGLTMLFWSPADRSFLSCAQARPQAMHGFDPIARYHAAGPWSGLGAPAQVTGRRITLTGALANDLGRLSAAESTAVIVLADEPQAWQPDRLQPWTKWSALAEAQADVNRSLLAAPRPMHDWVFVRPARFGPARFDPATQSLAWPWFDTDDTILIAHLRYDRFTAHAIERIEALAEGPNDHGLIVVAQVRAGSGGLIAEPLSLIRPSAPEGPARVDALFFDRNEPAAGDAAARTERRGETAIREDHGDRIVDRLPRPLLDARHHLRSQAERGIAADHALAWRDGCRRWIGQASSVGLTAFDSVRVDDTTPGAMLLRLNTVALQYEALLGADQVQIR